jgi:hypothetical protein
MPDFHAMACAREAAVSSWGAERSFDKLTSLKPALLSAPLRSSDHIRLLLLYPPKQYELAQDGITQQDHADIRCKVFQGRLSDLSCSGRPMYAALSYCWGSAAKSRTILCNDNPVEITENLFHAMKWVRLPTRPRFIWIDSLCIDQKNMEEKSQQVSRMSAIFSQAHVVSYIGSNTDPIHAQTCLAVVRRLAAISNYLFDRACKRDDLIKRPPLLYGINRPPTTPDWQSVPWDKVVKLIHENYFKRLWVFQEIQLARSHTCQWGLYFCSINQLNEAARMVFLGQDETIPPTTIGGCHVDYVGNGFTNVQTMARDPIVFDQNTKHGSSDLKLITECARLGCKDPRDRVYGLSSLFQGSGTYHVDYTSSVAEVFTKFTLHLLSLRKPEYHMPVLAGSHAHRSAYRDPDGYAQEVAWTWSSGSLPSWCPDYGLGGQKGLDNENSPYDWMYETLDQASPNGLLVPQIFPVSWNLLSARGIECATIAACSSQRRSDKSFTEFLFKAGQLALRLRDKLPPDEICVEVLDALRSGARFWKFEHPEHPSKSKTGLFRYQSTLRLLGHYYFEEYMPCMLTLCGSSNLRRPCLTDNQIKAFIEEMDATVVLKSERPRRCFITTADSPAGARFGCGPDGLRVGDKVFVIFGVNKPVVLRQVGRERRFMYIGNSQMHGLMEGEALGLGAKEEQVLLI